MNLPSTGWGSSTRGLGALISALVRYPEISSVQYNPDNRTLSATFILRCRLDEPAWQELHGQIRDVLVEYRWLTARPLAHIELSYLELDSVTSIELIRDVLTLSVEEIGMVIEVLRDAHGADLVADSHDLLEEELMLQEETIQASLEDMKGGGAGSLVALRDEGRVVVFNT